MLRRDCLGLRGDTSGSETGGKRCDWMWTGSRGQVGETQGS